MAKTDPKAKVELEVLQKCRTHLEAGKSIRSLDLSKEDHAAIADIFLLTAKPVMYVANVDEASMHTGNAYSEQLVAMAKQEGAEVIVMCNNIEAQISEMEDPDDKALFMEEYQMKEPALNRLIQTAYKLLKLEIPLTVNTLLTVSLFTITSPLKVDVLFVIKCPLNVDVLFAIISPSNVEFPFTYNVS
jgi:ribosome-binding ATPase YchF (GTP1/OBG family)